MVSADNCLGRHRGSLVDGVDAVRGDERVDRQSGVGCLQQFRLDGLPSGALHVFGVHEQVKGRSAVQGRAVLEE